MPALKLSPNYRGILQASLARKMYVIDIDVDKCTGCSMCIKACQKGVLRKIRERPYPYRRDLCMLCLSCIYVCPVSAMRLILRRS